MTEPTPPLQDAIRQLISERRYSRFLRALGAAILLAVVGNAVWELLARPGLTSVGRLLLGIVTFGSDRAKDVAYNSAALDPYPLTGLSFLIFLTFLVGVPLGYLVASPMRHRRRRNHQELRKEMRALHTMAKEGNPEFPAASKKFLTKLAAREKRAKRMFAASSAILVILGLGVITASSILSQAVLIRRVFHADLAICAPYLSTQQEEELRAAFAAVSSRSDYVRIHQRLMAVATANGVRLRDVALW